ncbi:ABC transporter ATP-binding protein [Spirochaeta thermophila]|uniref:Lipoprotein-releasing system ATP-binding protein LolD n=1 Tax=Winmispira thermophila (strain ATCC 49972 / DSM 6192 / RI 19.B1) TaxID=665571 RepID=E0RTF2_WINT6|nr:ABC transporter ATP-binding protein [Spirochaeta thermophila]ADN02183.1 lipoprotein-releasing system ATP-binding protein LolD [Spirochaeta thermophila DSM 6192]
MSDPIIVLEEVVKEYPSGETSLRVLDGVSGGFERGKVHVIMGESGSGKSTLLHLIGGLDTPTSGRVLLEGQDMGALDEEGLAAFRQRDMGFVFQMHYLLRECTSLENVLLPAYMAGLSFSEAAAKARDLLVRVGLGDRMHHYPSQLSGGERQRVAIARALVNGPRIVLADEPTGNLDERTSRMVEDVFFSLVREEGATLILVTHDAALASRADTVYRLEGGRLHRS